MKKTTFVLLVFTLIISGCINPGLYGADPFGNIGLKVDSSDSLKIVVEYVDNGAIIKGTVSADNVLSTTGQIKYDKDKFDLGYKQLSTWMCKYNPETNKVACASTTSAQKGEVFEFTLIAKQGTAAGKYLITYVTEEINTARINQDYDITINVR